MFSYGLYRLLSNPCISLIPTTNTPLVYNFKPTDLPIGTTDVFGITFTLTSFNGIPPNKFNLKSIFPTLLVSAVILLEV